MRKAPDETLPPTVTPCEAYTMSDRFRDWAVSQMQKEAMAEVSKAGLDRMTVLKGKRAES